MVNWEELIYVIENEMDNLEQQPTHFALES